VLPVHTIRELPFREKHGRMYKRKHVTVVIPAYNEENFVGQILTNIPSFVDRVIVVDDASSDATCANVKDIPDPRIVLLSNSTNQGVGASCVRGYRKALQLDTDIVVKVDADGQTPLDQFPCLLDVIVEEGYDYAKGNRFLETTSLGQMPALRLFGNMALTFLTKLASGYWQVFDPQNGFTAIKKPCLEAIDLDRIHNRYFFENDMLVQLNMLNSRVKDVPMPTVYGKEKSGISTISTLATFPWLFLHRFLHRVYQKYILRDFSPIAIFLGLGGLFFTWGIGFGVYIWVRSALTQVQASTGTVMLAVLPLILGFQLLLEALVLDINQTPR